jgi:hypothetical protein
MKVGARSRHRVLIISALGLSVAGLALVQPACAPGPELEPAEVRAVDDWSHVHIQVTAERMDEFEEGGGLLRRVPPGEAGGEHDVWLAYFPAAEISRLRARGFVVTVPQRSGLSPLANTPGETCASVPPGTISEKFCPYSGTSKVSTCKRTISKELTDIPVDFPPISGTRYAESFKFGETHEKRPILAARVGKLWKSGDAAVPQLVLYAAQHAREWAGPESLMRVFRHLAESWRANTNGIRTLLANVAVVIVPVANPDGYDFTHTDDRMWRGNREPCAGGFGTDPNRNYETTFGQQASSGTCSDEQFRGPSAGSAAETKALLNLFANEGLPGTYRTRFALNIHTYGNLMLIPDGLSKDLVVCTTDTNCTAPDHGLLQDLMGTELTPKMADEENERAYLSGQTFRHLYPIGGDSLTASVYGSASRPSDPKHLSAMIEITNTLCGFRAEAIPVAQFDEVAKRVRLLVQSLASKIPGIHSGSIAPNLHLPHLHRRQITGDVDDPGNASEFPTIRVAARAALGDDVALGGLGPTEQDDVRDGVTYRMWRARAKDDPFVFPPDVPVCVNKKCTPASLADPGTGKINLCDADRFLTPDAGWSFTGALPSPDERAGCFWKHGGTAASRLTSRTWSIASMVKSRLVYSIKRVNGEAKMNVLVSTNGFQNCSFAAGTGCRIVREYPFGESNWPVAGSAYRTEILDVSDFDHAPALQLRFDIKSGSSPSRDIEIYDPILIGWKG